MVGTMCVFVGEGATDMKRKTKVLVIALKLTTIYSFMGFWHIVQTWKQVFVYVHMCACVFMCFLALCAEGSKVFNALATMRIQQIVNLKYHSPAERGQRKYGMNLSYLISERKQGLNRLFQKNTRPYWEVQSLVKSEVV